MPRMVPGKKKKKKEVIGKWLLSACRVRETSYDAVAETQAGEGFPGSAW